MTATVELAALLCTDQAVIDKVSKTRPVLSYTASQQRITLHHVHVRYTLSK